MKKSPWRRKASSNKWPSRRSKIRVEGHSESSEIKRDIQALLREAVILRDGGCILRHYPNTGPCGSRETKDGHLILQAEHLYTRSNAASFADLRLVVCLCENHHIHYKPRHADEYFRIVRKHIGPERSALLDRTQEEKWRIHKVDIKLEKIALEQELAKLKLQQTEQ